MQKCAQRVIFCKLKALRIGFHIKSSFSISGTVSEIYFGKAVFENRLSGARGRKNIFTWVKIRLKYSS